ncbi:SDR family NAD(P)-dependent oxidoreductase [Paenibacillus sp. CC-CFT747]|nr:SDR family NAD(P)-dependent oxidoreductase [Paenibacillus sp. CC-CFT747]
MILKGKTAIITGGGSGIGEAAARCFASEGANLVLADWDEAGGTRVANQLNELTKGRARYVKTDVSSAEDVKNVVGAPSRPSADWTFCSTMPLRSFLSR